MTNRFLMLYHHLWSLRLIGVNLSCLLIQAEFKRYHKLLFYRRVLKNSHLK